MNMRAIKRLFAAFLSICCLYSFAACTSSNQNKNKNLQKVSFMLFWAPDTNHIGIYVAKNKGWFKDAGLDVDILAVAQTGSEHAVDSGAADFALSTLTNVADFSTKGANLEQVMQVQQKPSAIWCSLAKNNKIHSPKDFDGRTFATFGSAEGDAVIRRMIQHDGGQGKFDKVTVGTSTFRTLESGKADFGGFYGTWEGVQSEMFGPKLRCFKEGDYGVPGQPDTIGIITNKKTVANNPKLVRAFVKAAKRGYEYAYAHPDEASDILVKEAKDANLDPKFVKRSMKMIVDGQYWGSKADLNSGKFVFGTSDVKGAQDYFNFLSKEGAYTDSNGKVTKQLPDAKKLSTDEFLK
ncbi:MULTISPECIES: ABC transporter substrate-binding protein [Gardnerella]|nr:MULTISPECIES: ABC transporter substrate-binding protein [Gardnerella]PNP89935.1 ABC transporter substrate-binding protein [Gardnerella sp. KA00735]